MFASLDRSDPALRIRAAQSLAGLIAESNAAKEKPLGHSALVINGSELLQHLLSMLSDRDPLVRAHVLDSLSMLPLSEEVINSAAAALADPNWCARLLAFDLFAKGQGEQFKPVADKMSQVDPDPSVRALASLFLKVITPAGSSEMQGTDTGQAEPGNESVKEDALPKEPAGPVDPDGDEWL